jgi:hypothetical protein
MSYQIKRWDGIISNRDLPLPAISFIPDLALLDQLQKNTNNLIQIQIEGTNSLYDNTWVGMIDSSATAKGCRKNFYDSCHFYIITLLQDPKNNPGTWQGPPATYGTFTVLNGSYQTYRSSCDENPQVSTEPKPSEIPVPVQNPSSPPKMLKAPGMMKQTGSGIDNKMLINIAIILAIVGVVFLTCELVKSSKKRK